MSSHSETKLRLFFVDDNPLMVDCMRRLALQHPELQWVGDAASQADLLASVRALQPNVVLMDVDMPGVDTFALIRHIVALGGVRVVMLSGHLQSAYIEHAFDCGAWGYLSKGDDPGRLLASVVRVGRGEMVLSDDVAAIFSRPSMSSDRRAQQG